MTMEKINPEPFLRAALELDQARLSKFASQWIKEYCDVGECQLAYETFVYEIHADSYKPSPLALEQIKMAAEALRLDPPDIDESF